MGEPRTRVEPEIRYWECAFGVNFSVPMVRTAAPPAAEVRREVLGP